MEQIRLAVAHRGAPAQEGAAAPGGTPKETRSTCPYCGVGCGVIVSSAGSRIVDVRGDPDHPANFGRLCSKGSTLHLTADESVAAAARVQAPELRHAKSAARERVSWDAALDHVANRFAEVIRTHGPDAVAFYISGQFLTEDYYVFNKLAKGLIGTNNIDSNSRLCMSSAVAGYKRTLGADAPPACYEDLDHASCIFITGSNTAWAHPVLYRRLEAARAANPALRVIVADPRRTETAEAADLHLPLLPGTDVALHLGLLHILLEDGRIDRAFIDAHTEGFDALCERVREYTPAHTSQITGLVVDDLVQAARWIGESSAFLSLYCQGLNQSSSGTAKNESLINLHLALGQIGRPGAGPFSLTGQPNAMGGRETGGMANLASGHRDLANPAHRAEIAALWNVASVPETPGYTAVELFEACAAGKVKAIWIACTNPAQSLPDQNLVQAALERCELVVLQEAWGDTATAPYADVLLPATTWGEKEGTVTNSERRISRVRAARPAHGEARDDWRIGTEFARKLAPLLAPDRGADAISFSYASAEAVWNEHRESTRGRDLDITGLSYPLLEQHGPQQWPYPAGAQTGRKRLYANGVFPTASGRARFAAMSYLAPAEMPDARYPLSLNTGRLRDHWHGMSRTARAPRLFGHVPEPAVSMHPQDAARRGITAGDLVALSTRRGRLILPCHIDVSISRGQAYVPMHWGPEFVSGGINRLTSKAFDPVSRQPELKHSALEVERVELPWQAVLAGWFDAARVQTLRAELMAQGQAFDFASCVPFGRERHGLLFRLAHASNPGLGVCTPLLTAFGLEAPDVLRYDNPLRAQARRLRVAERRVEALALLGNTLGHEWLVSLLQEDTVTMLSPMALLQPSAVAPSGLAPAGRIVCNCLGVSERALNQAAATCAAGTPLLAHWQRELQCGRQCGSCLPEIKRMATQHAAGPDARVETREAALTP